MNNMGKKMYTGDAFLDKLLAGPYVKNPNYNPKTKEGKMQPQTLIDTSAGALESGAYTRAAESINNLSFTGRGLGYTNEEIESDAEMGITLSPYNTANELNKDRADSQSALTQFGNFLVQAGLGEVVVGTLEGFGNIVDGAVNSFTGDNYGKNPWTEFWETQKNNLKEEFKIYRENPNESWQLNDFGWWADNAVSVATTASLLIPAAGWARGISYLGKLSKINKGLSWASRGVSMGVARQITKGATAADKFKTLRLAGQIDRSIKNGTNIAGMALLSRTGEGYLEAKQVHKEVYDSSLANLNAMLEKDRTNGTNEFDEFIKLHPEFIKEDGTAFTPEEIATEIARRSANETFYNDYAMLLMDIMQFKALGKLWGRGSRRNITSSERIAAKNQKLRLAGVSEENLIKDNFKNRVKENLKYSLKKPFNSLMVYELSEGVEEIYQGIQVEKGKEVAKRYFEDNFTPRTLDSYLSDGHIWEQGFWGWIGGISFNKIGTALKETSHRVEGLYKKKHLTPEQYEAWKQSGKAISVNKINTTYDRIKKLINDLEVINGNKNPYNFVIDKTTGQKIIQDGELVNTEIDEEQKDLLKQEAIKNFIDDTSLDAIDNGTFDLIKDIIDSKEFDDYIVNNGGNLTALDKELSKQVSTRMKEVGDLYTMELQNVEGITENKNPYVTIATARAITRAKLTDQKYDEELEFLADQLANIDNSNGYNTNAYYDTLLFNSVNNHLQKLKNMMDELKTKYDNKEMSKAAYQSHIEEIDRQRKKLLELAATTNQGAFETFKNILKEEGVSDNTINEFNNAISAYIEQTSDASTPTANIVKNLRAQVKTKMQKAINNAIVPTDQDGYNKLYNDFALGMDKISQNKLSEYFNKIIKYLENSQDLDAAIANLLEGNTGNKNIDTIAKLLLYGYRPGFGTARFLPQIQINHSIDAIINKIREKRNKAVSANQEAANDGVTLPNEDNNSQTQNNTNPSPSTGVVPQADSTGTTGTTDITQTQPQQTPVVPNEQQPGPPTAPGTIPTDTTPTEDVNLPDESPQDNSSANATTEEQIKSRLNSLEKEIEDIINRVINDTNIVLTEDEYNKLIGDLENIESTNPDVIKRHVSEILINNGIKNVSEKDINDLTKLITAFNNDIDILNNLDDNGNTLPVEEKIDEVYGSEDNITPSEFIEGEEEQAPYVDIDVIDEINKSYNTPEFKATSAASEFIMSKILTARDGFMKAMKNADNQKAFISEVIDYIKSKGLDSGVNVEEIAKTAYTESISSIADLNNGSKLSQLAKQLVYGINKKRGEEKAENGDPKYSSSDLVSNEAIDEVMVDFLNEYKDAVGASVDSQGNTIININNLFNYLINNEKVPLQQAIQVYERLGKFIAESSNNANFHFTGFGERLFDANVFFSRLDYKKNKKLHFSKELHVHPVELSFRTSTKEYEDACLAAYNGAETFIVEEYNNNTVVNLAVYVKMPNGKEVKIGILRAVDCNSDGTSYVSRHHMSGFRNGIKIKESSTNAINPDLEMDCDWFFESIINQNSEDAKQLYYIFNAYHTAIILARKQPGVEAIQKALEHAMTEENAKAILNNPLVKKLFEQDLFKYKSGIESSDKKKAAYIASRVSGILFYGFESSMKEGTSDQYNDFDNSSLAMRTNYNEFKEKIFFNYKNTYELQKNLSNSNTRTKVNVFVPVVTVLNHHPLDAKENFVNIEDAGFDIEKHTPVMVKNGRLIDENGKDLGAANGNIRDYSFGFIVKQGTESSNPIVAYCVEAQVASDNLKKLVEEELASIIAAQFSNTNEADYSANWDKITTRLDNLFNYKGLFKFNDFKFIKNDNYASIIYKNKRIVTFYKTNSNGGNSNSISINGSKISFNANSFNTYNRTVDGVTQQIKVEEIIKGKVLPFITANMKLNRSEAAFKAQKMITVGTRLFERTNDGKFALNINGRQIIYENYADFLIKNRGFSTNAFRDKHGNFVTNLVYDQYMTINTVTTKATTPVNKEAITSLYEQSKSKRKTIDTVDLLVAGGVSQDWINILTGKISGVPFITSKVYPTDDETIENDNTTNAYFKNGHIHITKRGASTMTTPENTVRLLVHENIHRLFHMNSVTSNNKRKKIVNELIEVYTYARNKIEEDRTNGKISEKLYNDLMTKVFNVIDSYDDINVRMEEFLTESLTQPVLINYFNNTNWSSDVIIEGIDEENKSIFQKIIDILLKLFGKDTKQIKNNTILAKQYEILGKKNNRRDGKPKTNETTATTATTPTTEANIQPNQTKDITDEEKQNPIPTVDDTSATKKDDEENPALVQVGIAIGGIIDEFNSRIHRSANFTEDHTYIMNGEKVDTSVTQYIHGKQDIGEYGLPSSTLGTSLDDIARYYFNGTNNLDSIGDIPNFTRQQLEELKQDLDRLKAYFDSKFGEKNYRVVTTEFPIGGTVLINGEQKTIAGTTDLIIYTASGDIYIYDFKTKRSNIDATIDEKTISSYKTQVNIYKELILKNYPQLNGKVHAGGIIKFNLDYPSPNEYDYKVEGNQLKLAKKGSSEYENIQDNADYTPPYFNALQSDLEKSGNIIPVEDMDLSSNFGALPTITTNNNDDISDEDFNIEDIDLDLNDELYSATDLVVSNEEPILRNSKTDILTDADIYATPIVEGNSNNPKGVLSVSDMVTFINSFPAQYRNDIKLLLADDVIHYSCK